MSAPFILSVAVGALVCLYMPLMSLQPPLPGELLMPLYSLPLTAGRCKELSDVSLPRSLRATVSFCSQEHFGRFPLKQQFSTCESQPL